MVLATGAELAVCEHCDEDIFREVASVPWEHWDSDQEDCEEVAPAVAPASNVARRVGPPDEEDAIARPPG